jgi:putative addiction module antidote
MMTALKIRRIGNSLGVVIPKDVLDRLAIKEGEHLTLIEMSNEMRLTKGDAAFERKLEAARHVMKRRFEALRELAK